MDPKQSGRRRFLKEGASVAGLALGGMLPAPVLAQEPAQAAAPRAAAIPETKDYSTKDYKPYGDRSPFETMGRKGNSFPAKRLTPLQHLTGSITPSPLHFVADHSKDHPNIDPKEYRLLVYGMVDRPLTLSLDDLKRLPSVSRIHFLECNANAKPMRRNSNVTVQDSWGRTSNSEWTGVPLSVVLKEAGLKGGAKWLASDGEDAMHYSHVTPVGKAMDDVLIAYGQNGEAVRPEQGYPVRLLVPGFEAPFSVKWLRQIKATDEPYLTKTQAIEHAWTRPDLKGKSLWFFYQMPPKSVILRPSAGLQLPGPGYYEITGLAWSGGGAIRRVEVSTDGGKNWKDAKLQGPAHRMAHTRFHFDWTWNGQEALLQSRCTDDQGIVQPTLEAMSKSWGVEGDAAAFWGSDHAALDHGPYHCNAIQPWKVARDGSVSDAMLS